MEIDKQTIKVLSSDTRLKILKLLKKRRMLPSELSRELNLVPSTISEHLKKLEENELVSRKQRGHKWVYYELTKRGNDLIKPKVPTQFILVLSLAVIIMIGAIYGSMLYPLASKPYIEKPEILYMGQQAQINETHIAWVVNELGSYNLHSKPFSEELAQFEIVIDGRNYTVTIEDGMPIVQEVSATDPDIRIETSNQYIIELLEADSILEESIAMYDEGKIKITMLKSEKDLASKGYSRLYNKIYNQ